MENLEALKFPIGDFVPPKDTSSGMRSHWIEDITHLPSQLRTAVVGLSENQLETPYRPGGWTVRQVVHHIPDSHMNSYMRFRLALTEDNPTIRPYEEQLWAELPDAAHGEIDLSLDLLEMLHKRWVVLLKAMSEEDYQRTFVHPASGKTSRLGTVLAMYSWHGRHHLAHITELKKRMGW
ncbi:MAG: putative metal-dependent hydrolase [Imperialibacter sp.]|uniref:YfiT family bacillithiol transferase n=1 Tax=Imperialibacter sp. TaxID=2038411 RepID=UPI0032EAEF5E